MAALADPATGLAAQDALPRRAALAGAGRRLGRGGRPHRPAHHDRHHRPDAPTGGTTSPRCTATGQADRADRTPAARRRRPAAVRARRPPARRGRRAALRQAERDPAGITESQALALLGADGAELDALAALADGLRRDAKGDDVTFVVTRNINFTNVCYTGCRFCAFAQRRTDADAYTLSLDQIGDRAEEAWAAGATEVCMQGGIHPDLPGTAYFDIAAEVRRRCPEHARARVLADGGGQRGGPHRAAASGTG